MLRLVFLVAVAAASPNFPVDTTECALAKAEFQAAFDAAVAGEHAALAPVNNDVQAEQIPESFLEDDEDVAAAKAAFQAAFDDVEAGGLAAKQAPAPVHVIPEVTPAVAPIPAAVPVTYSHIPAVYPYYAYNHVLPSLPYRLPAFGLAGLPYNGLPVIA